jgi:chromosome segregation ATPase
MGVAGHTSHSFYSSGPDYAARRQRIRLEIQELENRHADAQATLKTNRHHYFQLSANVQKLKSEEYTLKQELQENLRKIGMLILICMHF